MNSLPSFQTLSWTSSSLSLPGISARIALLIAFVVAFAGCADDSERLAEHMERGESYAEKGQQEEAIIEFKNVLQIDPNHAPAHSALSLAYLEAGKPREAYWEMSEAVRLDPKDIEARLRYGTVSSAIREHDIALEQANAVLELDPTRPQAFVLRAQAYEAQEEYERAEADLRAAIENDPEGPAYRFLYAGFLERRDRVDEAEQQLRELIELEPSYLAMSNLARMVARRGDQDAEAEALLGRTIEVAMQAPEKAPERDRTKPQEGGSTSLLTNVSRPEAIESAHMLLAAFLFERDRFDEAIAALEEGIARVEDKTTLIYQMARFHRARGMNDEADALLRRATESAPDNPRPQLVLSAYLGQQGDLVGALEAARAAVAIDPENRTALLREAELVVDLGYRDGDTDAIQKGRTIVDAVLAQEPSNPEAHFVRAKIELAENDLEAAEQSLLTVIENRPTWSQARFVLGSTLAVAGEIGRARVELARAIELDPTLKEARKLLTQVHAQLGEHEFAVEQGRAYLSQVPNDSEVRIIVAQSLIRVGRQEQAYEEVKKIPEEDRDAAAYFALGRLDIAFGKKEQGHERLLKANEMAPGNPAVLGALLTLDREAGRLDASSRRIEQAAAEFPESSEIAELQAEIALTRKDLEGGRAALLRAVELEPRNLSAQLSLAELERRAGNADQMLAVMEKAAEALPDAADLQYRLGLAYEQQGDRTKAMAAYERAIALNGNLGPAKNNLAYLLADTPGGDLDRALELAQQAKEQLPDDPNTADTLGWVLLKRGVPSAAIGYLEEAAERFPKEAFEIQGIVRNHLAEAYEKNQDPAKAIAASKVSLDSFAKLEAEARKRGLEVQEPDWVRDARARIERLGKAG